MMQFHGPFRNRKAQPDTSAGAAAVFLHAVKRIENAGQGFFGNAFPIIAHGDPEMILSAHQTYIHLSAFRRIADGIANNVLDSPAQ